MPHPKYTGPVIDAHCHYDVVSIAGATQVLDCGDIHTAIHFWDLQWPPSSFEAEGRAWGEHDPRVARCHVPDLSGVGTPGNEQKLDRELRAAAAAGGAGVKIWKNLGLWLEDAAGRRLAADDVRLESLWHAAADVGLPVVIHQGDAAAYWAPIDEHNPRLHDIQDHPEWWYGGGDFPSLELIHEQLESLVAKNHRTTFVGLHFGCFMSWPEVGRMLATYPNYCVDTATAIADLGKDDSWSVVRELIIRHPDQVIFGTDLIRVEAFDLPGAGGGWSFGPTDNKSYPRWELSEYFDRHWQFFETGASGLEHPISPITGDWTVTGLDLPVEVLERFYWHNARRVFKLPAVAEPVVHGRSG